jgi:hypothetical protein
MATRIDSTPYYLLLTAYYSLFTAHWLLLPAPCSLLTAHCSLLTTCYFKVNGRRFTLDIMPGWKAGTKINYDDANLTFEVSRSLVSKWSGVSSKWSGVSKVVSGQE